MEKMGQPELSSLLEECIIQLQAGKPLEQILASYPYYANELRPLLETAAGMRTNQSSIVLPDEAMAKSRRLFVTQVTMQSRRKSYFYSLHLRLAVSLAIVILLVVGLLSTGLGSAAALPGDTLYPVKLAFEQVQINLATGPTQRLKLLEDFDKVRAQEVNQLKVSDRVITVTFTGIPTLSSDGWVVAGVKLNLTAPEAEQLVNLQGFMVQVTGETEGETVNVTDIQPRILTFSGSIQEIGPSAWLIGGVEVKLDSSTKITGTGAAGENVDVSAQRQDDGQLFAMNIDVHNENDKTVSRRSPVAGRTVQNPSPTSSPEVKNTQEMRPTDEIQPQRTVQPGGESTPVSTEPGEDYKTPATVSPSAPTRTQQPTEGDDGNQHKLTPSAAPSTNPSATSSAVPSATSSETHLKATPTPTKKPND